MAARWTAAYLTSLRASGTGVTLAALALGVLFAPSRAATEDRSDLAAWWRFDSIDDSTGKDGAVGSVFPTSVHDDLSKVSDKLTGFHKLVPGVVGKALRLGGIDSYVARVSRAAPKLSGPFTMEAWIALGAYPSNWCPIVAQADDARGILFGINARGHVGVQLGCESGWETVESEDVIPLGKWTHVACTYQPQRRVVVYRDGQEVAEREARGELLLATDQDLLIGKSPIERRPVGTLRTNATAKVPAYFDGLVDELEIYARVLSNAEIADTYAQVSSPVEPELPERRLPASRLGPGAFGAHYAKLDYYDAWDAKWRTGDAPDVVVRFDNHAGKFVFWHGASYIPHWVTENGIWYNNEFIETWTTRGCHEPMSDKECRFSHVRILECSPARTVVHWRYALVDNWYQLSERDEPNSWGEWVDEVYTIYPDAVAVRAVTLHSPDTNAPHEWHEGIVVMGPGQRPDDVLQPEALTLINLHGESKEYSWSNGPPPEPKAPATATIERINTKSRYKPFLAVPARSEPIFDIYAGEIRPDVSIFPWWNHWPTAFDPCDGRYALFADRASHSSLTHCTWRAYRESPGSMTKLMLTGLTDAAAEGIAKLARSWDAPPALVVERGAFESTGYDPAQRAYVLRRTDVGNEPGNLSVRIDASSDAPLVNAAMIIADWGNREAVVQASDSAAKCRVGKHEQLDSTDLVVWLECHAERPTTLTISPVR